MCSSENSFSLNKNTFFSHVNLTYFTRLFLENGSDVKQPHMKSHFNSKISPWESKLQVDNENIMETITEDLEIRKDPKIQKVVRPVFLLKLHCNFYKHL